FAGPDRRRHAGGPRQRQFPQSGAGQFRHVARHRAEQDQGQGVPHRSHRPFQRSDADGHAVRRRDGPRACQGAAPQGRRAGGHGSSQQPRDGADAKGGGRLNVVFTLRRRTSAMNAPVNASEDLLYSVEDGIARLTFNRPQARNALTFAMYEQLASTCESINADSSIKALILTGAGDKAFASGTDISQFRAFKSAQDALDYEARIDRVLGTLEQCRVPVIAAIAGACTGGGAGIAACCDIRIGTESTRIGFPIARTLGNCLSMSNISRLVSLIGPARTKDLIFKARLVEAPEALALGLLNEVVADVATLQRRADETAKLMASHAPITLAVTKEAVRRIRRTLSRDEGEDLILRAYMSEDVREGMDAFLNKRTPNWKGK